MAALRASDLQQKLNMGRARQAAQDTLVRVMGSGRVKVRVRVSVRVRVMVRDRIRVRARVRSLTLTLIRTNQKSRVQRLPSRLPCLARLVLSGSSAPNASATSATDTCVG